MVWPAWPLAYNYGYLGGALYGIGSRYAGSVANKALAVGAAAAGYKVGELMKSRRAGRAKANRRRPGRGVSKNAGRGRRKGFGRRLSYGAPGMRKRTAANVFPSGAQGYMARAVKRRKFGYGRPMQQAHEIQFSRKRVIKIGKARMLPRRQLKLGYLKRILRWQFVNTLNAGVGPTPGACRLSHKDAPSSGTYVPCVVSCLNSTHSQSAGNATPTYQLAFDSVGQPYFVAMNAQSADGSIVNAEWKIEYLKDEIPFADRFILNSWYDIRLNCYGAKAQPTLYDIRIVSFTKDFYDPLVGATGGDLNDRVALWQNLVHSFMSNPLIPANKMKKFGMITHYKTKFVIQPGQTIENDATPANRLIKLFVKDNSIYDYVKHNVGFSGDGADDQLDTVNWVPQGAGAGSAVTSAYPYPRARKWLIVRAMNTTRTADDSANFTPSMDLLIRKGEYMQSD